MLMSLPISIFKLPYDRHFNHMACPSEYIYKNAPSFKKKTIYEKLSPIGYLLIISWRFMLMIDSSVPQYASGISGALYEGFNFI